MKRNIFISLIMVLLLSLAFSGCSEQAEVSGKPAEIKDTINGNMKKYQEMDDGTWMRNGISYEQRLEISGRLSGAVCDTIYVYLSNLPEISFEQAWKASGLSSNSEDYFLPEDAVLVEIHSVEEASTDNSDIPKKPPMLEISTWDQTLEAMPEVVSWTYRVDGDRWAVLETSSLHPLDAAAMDIMPRLNYTTSWLDHMKSTDMTLHFAIAPDSIMIRCWSEAYWGDTGNDGKAEDLPATGGDNWIELKEDDYIYEIKATWVSDPNYKGTAHYYFYAAPCECISELHSFKDMSESHWAYWYVMEAANDHDYTKSSGETWSRIHR